MKIFRKHNWLRIQSVIGALEILEVYCTAYAQLALAIERIVAIVDKNYERRMTQWWKKALFIIVLVRLILHI